MAPPRWAPLSLSKTGTCVVILVALLCAVSNHALASAIAAPNGERFEDFPGRRGVIVIIADGFSLRDALEHGGPWLLSFLDSASIGMSNCRTADGGDRLLSAAATFGAGRRMSARESAGYGLGRDERINGERAEDVYLRRTGAEAKRFSGEILCLGYPELEAMGKQSPYRGRPGLIGESLRLAGFAAAAVGNSDVAGVQVRPGVLLVMDARGRVACGAVGAEIVEADPSAPFGISCDALAMAHATADALFRPNIAAVTVDFGDMNRLGRYLSNLSSEARVEQLGKCYGKLDEIFRALFEAVGPPSDDLAYILFSPGEPSSLGPVAIAGWQYPRGMLSSDTTRREGLVANLDLAATILDGLGVQQAWPHDGSPMIGIRAGEEQNVAERLMRMAESLQIAASSRVPVLSVFIGTVVIAVFSVLAVALLGLRAPAVFVFFAKFLLLSVAAQPLLILVAPILRIQGIAGTLLFASLGSAIISLLLIRTTSSCMWASVGIAAASAVVIIADGLAGGTLAATSLLGHSAIVGARYYGIGNELMGVLAGSAAICLSALGEMWTGAERVVSRSGKATAGAAIGVGAISMLLGHPTIGANFGGMVTAAAIAVFMGVMAFARSTLSRRAKVVAMVAIVVVAVGACAGMAWADAKGKRSSHIGRAWRLLTDQTGADGVDADVGAVQEREDAHGATEAIDMGLGQLGVIAWRKLEMNMRLLRYTAWTRVLLAFLIALTVLAGKPFGLFRRFRDDYPIVYVSVMGGLAGALVAMAVNDSGVVACATVAMMPAFALLGYVVDEILAEGA